MSDWIWQKFVDSAWSAIGTWFGTMPGLLTLLAIGIVGLGTTLWAADKLRKFAPAIVMACTGIMCLCWWTWPRTQIKEVERIKWQVRKVYVEPPPEIVAKKIEIPVPDFGGFLGKLRRAFAGDGSTDPVELARLEKEERLRREKAEQERRDKAARQRQVAMRRMLKEKNDAQLDYIGRVINKGTEEAQAAYAETLRQQEERFRRAMGGK